MSKLLKILVVGLVFPFMGACGGDESSFSLLADADIFQQASGSNDKVDILWVIDNSGSMATSQSNLANNMNSFISEFQSKNLDFRMTVIGTDSFRQQFGGSNVCSDLRDGPVRYNFSTNTCQETGTHNGYPIITPGTPDMLNSFLNNVLQGTQGYGDERPFQSISTSLSSANNSAFLRNDSFLSVIILTDEDDFSHDGSNNLQNNSQGVNHPSLHSVQSYIDYLDGVTGTSGSSRRYNVNSIAIQDAACRDFLNQSWQGRKIGIRVNDLADQTNGLKGDLCGDFASDLSSIADNILTLATQFYLSREPIPSTIVVKVNGSVVPERNSNPLGDGGWEWDQASNSIRFFGSNYFPAAGSSIEVTFDPVQYGG